MSVKQPLIQIHIRSYKQQSQSPVKNQQINMHIYNVFRVLVHSPLYLYAHSSMPTLSIPMPYLLPRTEVGKAGAQPVAASWTKEASNIEEFTVN